MSSLKSLGVDAGKASFCGEISGGPGQGQALDTEKPPEGGRFQGALHQRWLRSISVAVAGAKAALVGGRSPCTASGCSSCP